MSDEDLAEAAAAGNADAFRSLLERHYDTVYRLSYRLMGHREDAEDLAQDVCSALPAKLSNYQRRSTFTTWLYRVVLNAARDRYRRRATLQKATAGFEEISEMQRGEQIDSQRQSKWLYEALDQIGGDLRETAILVLGEEMTHAETAEILAVKESTVSWRMSKLKDKLKSIARAEA